MKQETLEEILNTFEPISLDQMSSVKLMNRTDTKFVTNLDKLKQLLKMACDTTCRKLTESAIWSMTPHTTILTTSICTACISGSIPTDRRYVSEPTA